MSIFYTVFDTETSGLKNPEPVQFAAVTISEDFEVMASYNTLLNPGVPIHAEATAVHGVTNEMVVNSPTWAQFISQHPDLEKDLTGGILIGHNIRSFDIKQVMAKHVDGIGNGGILDTLELAKHLWPIKGGVVNSHKLQNLIRNFNLPQFDAHDALGDVMSTIELLKFAVETSQSSVGDLIQLMEQLRAAKSGKLKGMSRLR